jgi:regulatory protein
MSRARKDPASVPDSSPAKARVAALALLGRRDYTASELTDRLLDKGYAPDDVRAALEALTADGTVNDARVATAIVRVASQVKGRGRLRIRQELLARGVDRHVADAALSGHGADDEAAALARVLGRKRRPSDSTPEARRKLFQQLMRRGFSPDTIRKVLKGEIDD